MAEAPGARPRGKKPVKGEPVVDRALRLLSAFEQHNEALSLDQLSTRARLPKATALRLAARLTAWGALERTDDGAFVIGLRLLEVATLSPRGHGLRAAALPFMEDLHHATRQHVLLAVRDGRHTVLVERLSAHRAGPVIFRVGGRAPVHATGAGLVLLAHAPHDLQEEVLAANLTVPQQRRSSTPDELRRTLAQVRREGVATFSYQYPEPMSSVAAPIYGARQSVVAALSVVAPTASFEPPSLAPAVITVAGAVSRAVQHSTGSP
ncbi:IclR family transcriptional regulator [Streptomyces sp. NPDC048290]|uniref:IclR family transcriptional regulator n=1 Tax=Streptomyces sp. NPDC048290 TaxID=3155811 RepID=UPI0034317744